MNTEFNVDEFLAHHGIKGQEWGVKNGPPYPLDSRKNLKPSKNRVEVAKKAASMTDEELRTANNRYQSEQTYIKNNYTPSGKDFVKKKAKQYGEQMVDKLVNKAQEQVAKAIIKNISEGAFKTEYSEEKKKD